MKQLNFRQVHLDFHTSGLINEIGADFSKERFKAALKIGHIDSITVFSKCHHGYSYHPTEINEMHPGLSFDLLGAQLEACREAGVNAPVYLSAGWDEKDAFAHPEWLLKPSPDSADDFLGEAKFHLLCYNSPYMEKLALEVEEVMKKYNPSGIFLDISAVRPCYCNNCIKDMTENGLDPENPEDVEKHAENVYQKYAIRIEEAVRKYNPDTTVFHNNGNVQRGRRDISRYNSHLELESLPTGGWGYDHFPMSAAYARTLGKDYLGMTGKFNTTWGEFGGFKHPNALRYETSLSLAFGAKCSIGDQLHPRGSMNLSTYELIGKAYAEVEQKEPYCTDVKSVSDIALIITGDERANDSDTGASRILLEGKYLFDILDYESDFSGYKLVILPDKIQMTDSFAEKLSKYLSLGGKVLATGAAPLNREETCFAIEMGAKYEGVDEFRPNYFKPLNPESFTNGDTEYVMYSTCRNISAHDSKNVFGVSIPPYFNRAPLHFSSHQHTPNAPSAGKDAVVFTKNTAYIAWDIFEDYAVKGELHAKELVTAAIEHLIGDNKTLSVNLPDRAVVSLMRQDSEKRYVLHLLFSHTTNRGKGIEVIEDTIPLFDTKISIRTDKKPSRIYKAPQGDTIEFSCDGNILRFSVDKFEIHQMIVIED